MVWKESMISLARKYNMSDTGLRNICASMNIPFPKAGHWEKIKWGKTVTIVPFDQKFSGQQTVSLMEREGDSGVLSDLDMLQNEIENDKRLSLIIPAKLISPDKLILSAKESLTNKPHKDYHTGMVSTRRDELSITVSPEFVGQALRFMDTMIKALRARGHNVYIKNSETYIDVNGEDFRICFRERANRVAVEEKWRTSEFHASGVLYFKVYSVFFQKEWDNKKVAIENQISAIIARIEIEAEKERLEMEYHRKMREEREEKERQEKEAEFRKEKEIADYKEVLLEAQRWHQTNLLRSYLDTIEQKCVASNSLSEDRSKWLRWMRSMADKFDPIVTRTE